MKTKQMTLAIFTFVALFSLMLSACSPAATPTAEEPAAEEPISEEPVVEEPPVETEPVTISYWHTMSDPETEQLGNVVAAFEAENPGITVKTTRYAYDDFKPAPGCQSSPMRAL